MATAMKTTDAQRRAFAKYYSKTKEKQRDSRQAYSKTYYANEKNRQKHNEQRREKRLRDKMQAHNEAACQSTLSNAEQELSGIRNLATRTSNRLDELTRALKKVQELKMYTDLYMNSANKLVNIATSIRDTARSESHLAEALTYSDKARTLMSLTNLCFEEERIPTAEEQSTAESALAARNIYDRVIAD